VDEAKRGHAGSEERASQTKCGSHRYASALKRHLEDAVTLHLQPTSRSPDPDLETGLRWPDAASRRTRRPIGCETGRAIDITVGSPASTTEVFR
jgi:hypothetical protein